jgi:hypothetical protein
MFTWSGIGSMRWKPAAVQHRWLALVVGVDAAEEPLDIGDVGVGRGLT